MKNTLSNAIWRLKGVAPHVPLQGSIMETGRPFRGLTPWIDCQVPGGVALALYRAGWIEYPYYGMNSLKCEWIENRWWMYETTISRQEASEEKVFLRFDGVDYDALVYVNGVFLGAHEGMFEPFGFDITELYRNAEELKIQVLIKNAPQEVGQVGHTSQTTTQKSRFGYKWDFGTRLVNLGIWKDVYLSFEEQYALDEFHITSDLERMDLGVLDFRGTVRCHRQSGQPLEVRAEVRLDGTLAAQKTFQVEDLAYSGRIEIEAPAIWYPNGMGAQPLYDVCLTLWQDGKKCLDRWQCRQGIRRLRFLANETAPEDALPYTYEVNFQKVYIKGVNMTPLDHIYGDIPEERYRTTLTAIARMNVNMIRVWGGGLIEKEIFYDLCDQYGILVWQEFIQSSSGIENVPSQKPEFLALLRKAATCAVKRLRNHTSLAAWSGGNELQDIEGRPSRLDDANIAMLQAIVGEGAPERFFYPTSASGPNERQSAVPNTSHDVHGDWEYGGNPAHYPAQALADHLFNSEFGCSGVSGSKSATRVLPREEWTPANMRDNAVWRFRGDWWDTYERDTELFGEQASLPEFASCSQWIQAEAVRYTVEANRRRAFRNSGSIIWQFNEPWPNIANTCLYTYFDEPKMAYFWAKHAYGPFHVSLDYRRLDYQVGAEFRGDIWLSADAAPEVAEIRAEVLNLAGERLCEKRFVSRPGGCHSSCCGALVFQVPQCEVFVVRLTAEAEGQSDTTLYYFSTAEQPVYAVYLRQPEVELETELVHQEAGKLVFRIRNTANRAALHIHGAELSDRFILLPEEDFFTLFPGEEKLVAMSITSKFNFGFDEYPEQEEPAIPQIAFHSFPIRTMLYDRSGQRQARPLVK